MCPLSTSSSKRPFLLLGRAVLFLGPFLLIFLYFEIIFWRGGESATITKVIDAQIRDKKVIFSRRFFSHNDSVYKYLMIRRLDPKILILGSSRVLSFRSEMFKPLGEEFYNAGRLVNDVSDLVKLSDSFSAGEITPPRVMIIGVDPWWLRRDYEDPDHFDPEDLFDEAFLPAAHIMAIRAMIKNGKFYFSFMNPFKDIRIIRNNWKAMGLGAIEGKGYRHDGYRVDLKLREDFMINPEYRDREDPPVIERVRQLKGKFSPTPGLSRGKCLSLIDAVRKFKALGVEVYLFFPPFSNEVAKEIMASHSLRNWINEFYNALPVSLSEAGIPSFGVISPDSLGLGDIYMVDGFHPGEVLISHVMETLLDMIPENSYLAAVNRSNLKAMRNLPGTLPISFPS